MAVLPVVILFAFIAILLVNIIGFVRGHGGWTHAFEQVATRYGGWYSSARATRPPAATFKYKNAEVRVRCRRVKRDKGRPETEFRIRWLHRGLKMEVLPGSLEPKLKALKGTTPVTTGDARFDQQFRIFIATNAYVARVPNKVVDSLLSSGVRWQIMQLHQFMDNAPVRITFEKGWLYVRKNGFIKEAQMLDDFVRFSLELYDQFVLTTSEGIEFQDDQFMAPVEQVRCPVCGSDIEGKMVICVRCKTPHCLDCWQYNSKCGMYACDEGRYMIVGGEHKEGPVA